MELRKEINKILENTILPEGISNEEMKNPDTFMASKCMLYKSPQWSYEKE